MRKKNRYLRDIFATAKAYRKQYVWMFEDSITSIK